MGERSELEQELSALEYVARRIVELAGENADMQHRMRYEAKGIRYAVASIREAMERDAQEQEAPRFERFARLVRCGDDPRRAAAAVRGDEDLRPALLASLDQVQAKKAGGL